jgi:dUTP pyrophosphatase
LPRPITVRIKRLNHSGTTRLSSSKSEVPLPAKMTQHSAGFDLYAAPDKPVRIGSRQITVVPCGFAMAIPEGYEAQIRPRSGLASKFGITLVNTPGTIDSDYRGEVMVPLINLGKKPFTVERGMRIAQMLIAPVPKVKIVEVKELDATRRGKGGFGHTGH